MDKFNTFHTPTTFNLERLDWAVIMLACIAAVLAHWEAINWWRFIGAFLFPDLIGTAPGLYFYYARRAGPHRSIPPVIHKLYNFGHCFAVTALLCGLWWSITGSLEWAMMA